jgi:nitrite reductase/ring-hydroxylating ferredoxin subunit/uncharacterized membrane protein
MQSRAQINGHPLHPALIPFPFAFLTGALVFDLLGLARDSPALWITGGHLTVAGLLSGVLAAIPGMIDYVGRVPPRSSAKGRALRHAAGNVTALALFALAFALRGEAWEPSLVTVGLELGGAALLGYAGALGGTLVSRNLISVDHRQAESGHWREATIPPAHGDRIVIGRIGELKDNQMKLLHINGHRIVLARTAGGYRAFDDRCSHRGASLADGVVIDGVVQCLWHGSQFQTAQGTVKCGPARASIRSYQVSQSPAGELTIAPLPPAS